ncbi:hypothetical protein Pcinc_042409 [Petrolisthes cinctipes]|uniref:ABC transporter domain-containing protein n=1 Tax=Petrolisthes cinctipes TaxID=88211 RepID=A0AAE1BIV4_PETCI|nr:hypothetical protein Pcinc_042409 [Petrolisthes cinctipes]
MSVGLALEMLLLDTAIFTIIAIIVNIFTTLRCTTNKPTTTTTTIKVLPAKDEFFTKMKTAVQTLNLDPELKKNLKKGLTLVGVRKTYQEGGRGGGGGGVRRGGTKLAVDNVTLELYEGQVLALLGHNGAGKTTIIQKIIGLCPQRSVLFPMLTVAETLTYYATLKNGSERPSDILQTLDTMGLTQHQDHRVYQLCQGLRRRVCVCVALVGDSKLIVLDEPTAGVDPATRSAIWETSVQKN